MKKAHLFNILVGVAILFMAATSYSGEKFGYVDMEYVLKNIPAYETAQNQIEESEKLWTSEIKDARAQIESLYKKYENESAMLSEDMRRKREDEIISREKEVRDLSKKFFGDEGELYNKRKELIEPILDNVRNAIQELGKEGNYQEIKEIASSGMLYYRSDDDVSDEVLNKLGYGN
ncbi:MAG: OmpH family outer membrane protein [Bacteroidales bacterium]|nr:OmpH family outer membrane protein [Bacteroidales bacterium]